MLNENDFENDFSCFVNMEYEILAQVRLNIATRNLALLKSVLRLLSAPGAELVMPIIAPSPVLRVGDAVRSWFSARGLRSPRGGVA